ncbi:hypothetical protein GH714_037810 [Hevea brasiliensis]|uniref:Peptide deformylase n=1 Tax=Hevea brasiliensis TaxID=3981 RepID=A0A6A6LSJ4_HEVBR|nr:hypothetical protein GH714_037810 [Hevea brasiliensis]
MSSLRFGIQKGLESDKTPSPILSLENVKALPSLSLVTTAEPDTILNNKNGSYSSQEQEDVITWSKLLQQLRKLLNRSSLFLETASIFSCFKGFGVGIIVLEDTKEYIGYAPKEETKAQDRRPFDLLVILNPKLTKKSNRTAFFFEGCLSVDGFRAVVERYLDVEVTGLNRYGQPIKVDASGWQARILQHECDHLDGTLFVDKMVPRTFRTVENLDLPLAEGCPKLGAR